MTMKRFCATALLLLWSLCALAVQKSGTIVYINGSKFYVHTVQPGETLYGLSKAYEVGEKVILQHNPAAAQGLRAGESIKIPFVSDVPQPKSERKLRKTFDIHTVTQGETLYGISRKYEIPIQTVIEDNPSLDPTNLRLGERILIRKKEIGSEDEAGAKEQWEATAIRSTASPRRVMPIIWSSRAKPSIRCHAASASPKSSSARSTEG